MTNYSKNKELFDLADEFVKVVESAPVRTFKNVSRPTPKSQPVSKGRQVPIRTEPVKRKIVNPDNKIKQYLNENFPSGSGKAIRSSEVQKYINEGATPDIKAKRRSLVENHLKELQLKVPGFLEKKKISLENQVSQYRVDGIFKTLMPSSPIGKFVAKSMLAVGMFTLLSKMFNKNTPPTASDPKTKEIISKVPDAKVTMKDSLGEKLQSLSEAFSNYEAEESEDSETIQASIETIISQMKAVSTALENIPEAADASKPDQVNNYFKKVKEFEKANEEMVKYAKNKANFIKKTFSEEQSREFLDCIKNLEAMQIQLKSLKQEQDKTVNEMQAPAQTPISAQVQVN